MNPARFSQMMKYLTRAKKANPELPDVFPASKAPIPSVREDVAQVEAINRFVKANPRQDMAGGGRIGFFKAGMVKQGVNEGKASIPYFNDGKTAYFKDLETAEKAIADRKDKTSRFKKARTILNDPKLKKEFIKYGNQKDVSIKDIRKKFNISMEEFYDGGLRNLFDKDFQLQQAKKIKPKTINNINKLLNNKEAFNFLKKGQLVPDEIITKLKLAPSEAATATVRISQIYGGNDFGIDEFKKIKKNVKASDKLFESMNKFKFGNPYRSKLYQASLELIDQQLGNEKGTFESLKNQARYILKKNKIKGFDINEIAGVTGTARTGAGEFSQFIDIMDSNLNQKQMASFQSAFSQARQNIMNDPNVFAKESKRINRLAGIFEKEYGVKLPRIRALNEVEKFYSPKRLKELADQGLDIKAASKKLGYTLQMPRGAITATEFVDKTTSLDKKQLKTFLQKIGCPGLASGGRAGFDVGTNCQIKGAELINSGMKNASPAQLKNFAAFANRTASLGRNVMKFGVIPEALYVAADSAIRLGMGDSFNEAFLRASEYIRPGDQTKLAEMLEADRFFGPEVAGIIGKSIDYKNQLAKVQSLEDQKANLENLSGGGAFDYVGDTGQDVKNIDAQLKQATDNLNNKFKMTDAEQIYADRMQKETDDARSSGSFFTKLKSKFRDLDQDQSDIETLGMPEKTQKQLNEKILPAFGDSKDFITLTTADAINLAQAYRAQGSNISAKDVLAYRDSLRNASLSELAQQFNPESVYGASGTMGEPINKPPMEKKPNIIPEMEKEIVGQTNVANPFDLDLSMIGSGLRGFSAAGGGIAKMAGDSSGPPPVRGPNPQGLLSLKNRVRNY